MKTLALLIFIVGSVLIFGHVAQAQSVPAANQAFALGLSLQAPTAQAEAFLQAVRGLRDANTADGDPAAVGRLAQDARALRGAERQGYEEAARRMAVLGAPADLRAWVTGIARLLKEPQIVSNEAKPYVKRDPATAAVLSTIDEAEAVRVIADRNAAALQAWLKLTQGAAGVWTFTLGRLTAGMEVAAVTGQAFLVPRATALRLHDTSPPGTPPAVLKALATLAPRGRGNLSYLIHPPPVTVPAAEVGPPAWLLLGAYGAQPLAQTLAPLPAPKG